MHFITRAMPIDDIDARAIKKLKSSRIYSTDHITNYLWPQGTHIHTHTHSYTHTFAEESDFKKPGTHPSGLKIFMPYGIP